MRAYVLSSIELLSLFADEWPRPSVTTLREGKPASFRLFPVGSDVVVYSAGSFLPTLVGLLNAIRWCGCHHASCAVSTPSTNALASHSLSPGGPLGLLGGFGDADFRLQPRPALEGGPLRLTHKRTDQEHRQARGEAPGGLVRGFSGSGRGTSDGAGNTVTDKKVVAVLSLSTTP